MPPSPKRTPLWYAMPFLWLAGMLALAGLLAPLFWWGFSGIFDDDPFSRFTNRALMVAALLTLVPYFIAHWRTLGLGWERGRSGRYLVAGLLLGIAAEVAIVAFHLINGTRDWRAGGFPFGAIIGAVLAGAAVGLLEEILFRGVVQQALIKRIGLIAGWVLASAFYAIVHYVKVPSDFRPDPVTITSGWEALGLAFAPLADPATWVDLRLLILFLLGLLLGGIFLRTGSLWMPIGLHAGVVMGIKMANKATDTVRDPAAAIPVHGDMTDGTATLVILVLLGAVLFSAFPKRTGQA